MKLLCVLPLAMTAVFGVFAHHRHEEAQDTRRVDLRIASEHVRTWTVTLAGQS